MGWDGPTNRQVLAYDIWSFFDERIPSRTDWYIMQNTAEIRSIVQAFASLKRPINLSDFKLVYNAKESMDTMKLEERTQRSKETWMLGAKTEITHITKDKYGNVLKVEKIQPVVPKEKRR